jgi:hypothetical protein
VKTGLAWLSKPESARAAYEGQFRSPVPGEGQEACLARIFPDFVSLAGHSDFDAATQPVLYYTSNSTANWTLNIRGSASLTLNSMLQNMSQFFPPLERISKIKIRLRYHDGRLVDFSNCDFNFTLEFDLYRDEMARDLKLRIPAQYRM